VRKLEFKFLAFVLVQRKKESEIIWVR